MNNEKIDFTRIDNDSNGNPRYVCHFLRLSKETDFGSLEFRYQLAIKRANKIGGRKFHNKKYGGGVVFQSYNIDDTEKSIKQLLSE